MVNRARPPEKLAGREVPPRRPPRRPRAPRNRAAELVAISVLVALFVLLGLGVMLWAVENRLAFGPTPTPTPTAAHTPTPTADFRATQTAQDFLTQVAYEIALLRAGIDRSVTETPTPPIVVATDTVTPPADALPPDAPVETPLDPATATPANILLPGLGAPEATPTPDPAQAAAPQDDNITILPIIADSPLPTPEAPPIPEAPPTELPTPEPPPTEELPTPTPEATATPLPYRVTSLRANTAVDGAPVYVGPSTTYTQTAVLEGNLTVSLLGRNASGEWVYLCCYAGEPVWARQFHARPSGNELDPGAPEGARANDVRWLPEQFPPSMLTPMPAPTLPAPGDFPMLGYDYHAGGRVPTLPQPPLISAWSGSAQAAGGLSSPAVIAGDSVLVASDDGHLYSFDRTNGNQRWRFNLGGIVRMGPVVHDGAVYVADENRRIHGLEDRGNQAVRIWERVYDFAPREALTAYGDSIFIVIAQGSDGALLGMNRDNGDIVRNVSFNTSPLRYPVIGDQLLYLAGNTLRAFNLFDSDVVWQRSDINNFQTNPVYGTPGAIALAELYVLDGSNRLRALDANTGDELWSFDTGEPALSLGLSETAVLVAGNGYLKSISRLSGTQLWRTPVTGLIQGIPLNNGATVLVVTQSGNVLLLDLASGSIVGSALIPAQAGGAPAVGGGLIYVPGTDGRLHALRGN